MTCGRGRPLHLQCLLNLEPQPYDLGDRCKYLYICLYCTLLAPTGQHDVQGKNMLCDVHVDIQMCQSVTCPTAAPSSSFHHASTSLNSSCASSASTSASSSATGGLVSDQCPHHNNNFLRQAQPSLDLSNEFSARRMRISTILLDFHSQATHGNFLCRLLSPKHLEKRAHISRERRMKASRWCTAP